MELKMFEAIDYTMGFALSIQFLRRLSKTTQDALDAVQETVTTIRTGFEILGSHNLN